MEASSCVNPASRAICSSYPDDCGLTTWFQVNVTGIDVDTPPAGETTVGAAAIGALNEIVKVITFDGGL